MHILKLICKRLLLVYGIYALISGIFLYLIPFHPQNLPKNKNFYGESNGSDRAALVESPEDAFSRRIEIIRSARNTLDVSYHCLKAGETSDCFFAEIIKAADRGVKVRVILDGAIGGLTGPHKNIDLALISHPNIEYRAYNPINLLKPWAWNVRLHDKFILADDKMLMLGGRNIGDQYFNPPVYQGPVTHDRDVLIINTAAGTSESPNSITTQVKNYMDILWNAKETKHFTSLSEKKRQKGIAEQKRLLDISDRWEKIFSKYYLPAVPAEEISVPTRKVTLLYNPVNDFKKAPIIGASLAQLLSGCEDIRIQTPYATANHYILAGLQKLGRKKKVQYLTNSPASTPNFPAFSVYLASREKFINTGITIHEYQSQNSIHGKSCTADHRISVVGSFNLDDRSLYIDTESVLVIDSPEFAEVLNGELDKLFAQAAVLGPDNKYLPGQDVEILEASLGKQILLKTVSFLSRPLEFLI